MLTLKISITVYIYYGCYLKVFVLFAVLLFLISVSFLYNPRALSAKKAEISSTGSFGTYPSTVQIEQRRFQEELERSPDVFIRYHQPRYLDEARKAAAKLLNVPKNETVFVPNASTGVNTVLRNLAYVPDDVIVYFATVYPACEKAIESLMETTPVQARRVAYEFPISQEEIVKRFSDVVKQVKAEGMNVRVALLDAVVSLPGVRFPFEALVKACREEGILSCVDGAHGIGHIPLDLGILDADFFVSNCHK
jgi:selenocysteine lyase/cysteine desulfurase